MTVRIRSSGRSRAISRSSSSGSPKCMKRPPLQVPIAVRVGSSPGIAEHSRQYCQAGMAVDTIAPWAGLVVALFVFLWLDLRYFARESEPNFRQALTWSIGWFVLSLVVAIPVLLLGSGEEAIEYTTVYLIERSLSLDN